MLGYVIAVLIGLALWWFITPSKKTIGMHRWGRHISGACVGITTISQLWHFSLPAPAGGINAIATWLLISISLGCIGYLIGITTYGLFRAGQLSKSAIPAAKELAENSIHYIQTPKLIVDSKKCPFCAETIKKEAIICRFCGNQQLIKNLSSSESNNIKNLAQTDSYKPNQAPPLEIKNQEPHLIRKIFDDGVRPWWANFILAILGIGGVIMALADKYK